MPCARRAVDRGVLGKSVCCVRSPAELFCFVFLCCSWGTGGKENFLFVALLKLWDYDK